MCFQTWVLGIAHHANLKTGLENVEKYQSPFYALLLTTYFVLFCVTSQLTFKNWKILVRAKILNSLSISWEKGNTDAMKPRCPTKMIVPKTKIVQKVLAKLDWWPIQNNVSIYKVSLADQN